MKLSVFLHDGQVYVSPTRTWFPRQGPPPLDDSPTSSHVSPSTWHRCMWAKKDYIEMAFIPTALHLEGQLFRDLRFYHKGTAPLEERQLPGKPPEYRIAHAMELYELERTLVNVRNVLQAAVEVYVTLNKEPVSGPSSESYMQWSRDKADVLNRAFFVRRKFLYHIAMISFHIAIISHDTKDDHRWYSILLEKQMPGPLADKLASTLVADFRPNVSRAGAFIRPDVQTASWVYYVNVLIAANVPVYVAWGPASSRPSVLKAFEKWYPEVEIANVLNSQSHPLLPGVQGDNHFLLAGGEWTSQPDDYSDFVNYRAHTAATEPDVAPLHHTSGEYYWKGHSVLANEHTPCLPKFTPSDTPGSFFSRRADARKEFISTLESPRQKDVRRQREKEAFAYAITAKGHDQIYEWDFDDDTMRWTRNLVPRKSRVSVWEMYWPACKRYDSVANEWDVAVFLDNVGPLFSMTEEYELLLAENDQSDVPESALWENRPPHPFFHPGDYQLSPLPPGNIPPPINTQPQPTQQPVIQQPPIPSISTTSDCAAVDEEQEVPNVVGFVEVLLGFHAFRWGSSNITEQQPVKRLSLDDACKAVGFYIPDHGTHILREEPDRAPKFIAWVALMLDQKESPPEDWWLLHPNSQDKLKQVLMTKGYPLRLSVMRNKIDRQLWWCLHKQCEHPTPWFIAVADPTVASAAIQSRRCWNDIGRWMVASGISFHTLRYSEAATYQNTLCQDPRPPLRLTIRPFNHVFTAADFEAYEYSRSYLFMDPRLARAALLAGGILWRLAIEEVAPDLVLDGPHPLSFQLGFGFRLHNEKDGGVYMDDELSNYEMGNIVGMYYEKPDAARDKWDHDTYPMWWPLPTYFKGSALDYPMWTPVAENWYQKQRERYRQGTAGPKQGSQWRTSLRNWDKRSRQLTERSRETTDILLRRMLYD